MSNWNLPTSVEIDGKKYAITQKCDYRVVLDVIKALKDNDLSEQERVYCALYMFYEDLSVFDVAQKAVTEMMKIINNGEEEEPNQPQKPILVDWEHDFSLLCPPINRVLGYSLRNKDNYTHWYDFIGAYMEIGECNFATVVSIRSKRAKGQKLEKHEQEFYKENKKMVDLPFNLTEEEQDWLDYVW